MEYSTEPVAVFFESGELCPEKALRFCGEEASGVGQVEGPPVHPREALRQLHKATLEKQLASDGPPLTLSALINLFVSSAFLDVGDDLMVAILSALNSTLLNLSPRSASSSSSAGPRCVTPLEASSVAVALARVESIVTQLGKTSTAASRMKEEMGSVERALLPVLQPDALLARGSARCVMRLLCDCPSWTRRCGLEEGCLRALRDHAGDGFTRANLERLLRHNASNLLLLPADVKESVERCLVELPIR
ncbi:unnamed protein product [Trypanosoma congolense IL3000]|uniref:WGS project CAEQ00000000 data, annotated contig 1465 n=1 Tax=Trypanosoma congolense (strain IL3000) TaxID=1068625 RepID=F9W6G7_TRYCI|nr:unnamed protein product [Trypanosoma congolense IL3000]